MNEPINNAFFRLQRILPSAAVTAIDYRKLIIDRIAEVQNAWVISVAKRFAGNTNNLSVFAKFVESRCQFVVQRKLQQMAQLQGTAQKMGGPEEEELLQGKFEPVQRKENKTDVSDELKSGIESLSGIDMSDVQVHYNSSQPAQLNALAFAQGTDIHIAPGQEQHLPHEAWHVAQQKQGCAKPIMSMEGQNINYDPGLEQEAAVIGTKALPKRLDD